MGIKDAKEKTQNGAKEKISQPVSEQDMALYLNELAAFLLKVFSENKVFYGNEYGKQRNKGK